MEEMDVDGNGTVEFEEFLNMMTRKEEKVRNPAAMRSEKTHVGADPNFAITESSRHDDSTLGRVSSLREEQWFRCANEAPLWLPAWQICRVS